MPYQTAIRRIKRRHFSASCTVLLTLFNPLNTLAAPDHQRQESVVVTASRDEQLLKDSSASLSVISAEDLQQIGHVHISEALARSPGVWVSRGNGQEHLTAIRSPVLTGAGSCGAFMIAEDGVPVRATGFCNVNQLFDINTEQAQRIEVLRGPGTSIHGSDALHGVINAISLPPAKQPQKQLALGFGANDFSRIKYSQSLNRGQHGVRISMNAAHDGGYKHDAGFDQQKLTVRHDFSGDQLHIKTLLSATNLNQETAGFVEGTDAYKDRQRKRENPNPEAFRDSQSLRLQSRIDKALSNKGTLTLTPYLRYTDMAFLMHFLPGTPLEENGQHSVGLQTLYSRPINQQLQLSQGIDLEYTDAFLKQSQSGGFSSFPAGKQYDYDVSAQLLAAFINARYQLNSRSSVNLGTRYEWLEYDYDNRMLSGDTAEDGSQCINGITGAVGCRYSRPDDSTDDFDNWSFNASLHHQWSDQHSGFVRLAHGFRAPQATEMYRLQNGQTQALLDAEEISSIELAYSGQHSAFDYQLAVFFMNKTNVIVQSSSRLNLDDGQTEHYGLEYQLNWQLAESLNLTVAGTFARHRYTSNVSQLGASGTIDLQGNDVDTAPRQLSTAQLNWQPTERSRVELEWVSMGKYYTDIDNLNSYQGHDLLHLRVRQQVTEQLSVGLRVNNLTDRDYAERADFSSFGGDRYFIGEPRSLFADVSFTF